MTTQLFIMSFGFLSFFLVSTVFVLGLRGFFEENYDDNKLIFLNNSIEQYIKEYSTMLESFSNKYERGTDK